MHEKVQKVEWRTQSKISCHYTWLLHAKNYPSRWCFLRSFLTASNPSRRSITAAKRREKEKKEGRKKIPKFWFLRMLESQCTKTSLLVARRASCCVANAFSTGLKVIWLRSSLKMTKMSKKALFVKSSRSQWVKQRTVCIINVWGYTEILPLLGTDHCLRGKTYQSSKVTLARSTYKVNFPGLFKGSCQWEELWPRDCIEVP